MKDVKTAAENREWLKNSRCVVVSACLLGVNCKYNGGNNLDEDVIRLLKGKKIVSVCPETAGGLSVPRNPCEIKEDRVIDNTEQEMTDFFKKGALNALKTAIENGAEAAVLQPRSPSCGSRQIYDGSFSKRLISGQGIFAKLLAENGIKVIDADEL